MHQIKSIKIDEKLFGTVIIDHKCVTPFPFFRLQKEAIKIVFNVQIQSRDECVIFFIIHIVSRLFNFSPK
jgi:hypothetical protein